MTYIAARSGRTGMEAARLASYSTGLLGTATVLGALIVPLLAEWLGRRITLGILFALTFFSIFLAFGHVFYMQEGAVGWFMVSAFFLGLGGANFIVYSFWLPEQYGTECRASAFAFTTNVGRSAAAGFTLLVGARGSSLPNSRHSRRVDCVHLRRRNFALAFRRGNQGRVLARLIEQRAARLRVSNC
jgi:MFS family permease